MDIKMGGIMKTFSVIQGKVKMEICNSSEAI
jgi:hypothetical protein